MRWLTAFLSLLATVKRKTRTSNWMSLSAGLSSVAGIATI